MSNFNYHENIIVLRSYALKLNWFKNLFFPQRLKEKLKQYSLSGKEDPTMALQIYSIYAQSFGVFNWFNKLGRLFLSGLTHFAHEKLTQTINELPSLTKQTFLTLLDKEKSTPPTNGPIQMPAAPQTTPNIHPERLPTPSLPANDSSLLNEGAGDESTSTTLKTESTPESSQAASTEGLDLQSASTIGLNLQRAPAELSNSMNNLMKTSTSSSTPLNKLDEHPEQTPNAPAVHSSPLAVVVPIKPDIKPRVEKIHQPSCCAHQ